MDKKIIHLLKSNSYSGAENVVCQIINMFEGCKYSMFYCSPDGLIANSLNERNIDFIPMKRFSLLSLRKIVRYNDFDIVHAHDPGAAVLVAFTCFYGRIIAHVHGNHDNMKICTLKSIAFLISSIRFSKIVWVSRSSMVDYYFYKFIKNKSIVLVNTVNNDDILSKINKKSNEFYDCIFLGRLSPEKNPIRAINIIDEVIKLNPNYKAAFVGEGILKEACKEHVSTLHIEGNIIFKGYLNNPIPILANSDVLLMTSIYEGTPMCALEAMCLGKPIVSTPTDGLMDLIINNKTGHYSDKDDSLSEILIKLKNNKNLYKDFSSNTKNHFLKINNRKEYKERLGRLYEEM